MAESLKKQTFVGVGWSAIERFSVQGAQFLLQIVLARLLVPSDYGIIAMLAIFLQIAQVLVDCGFANALVQKQQCTNSDYSTVFFFNLGVSVTIYLFFFIIAPYVATFYAIEEITEVMRVIALVVILNSLSIVQRTILVKRVDFKSQSVVTFSATIVSGLFGIYFAYNGYGVWALCFQQLINSFLQAVLYYFFVRWLPSFEFSKESFKDFMGFGSKILVARLISVTYKNLYTLTIGKKYNSEDLGYFSRAEQFAIFPSANIGGIISRVSYPIFSKIQDDDKKLTKAYREIIRYSSFLIFPLMFGLASLADPFIETMLGTKWLSAAPILQILCLDLIWDPISLLNLNLLYVKKRSDLVLKLEVLKKIIAITILVLTLPYGVVVMCWGRVFYSFLAFYINTYYTKKIIGIGFLKQLSDVFPFFMVSLIMGVTVNFVATVFFSTSHSGLQLAVGVLFGVIIYTIITFICFKQMKDELIMLLKKR